MADNKSDLRTEVRTMTDFSVADLPQADLDEVISIAKREVEGVANTSVTGWYSSQNAELALFWTTCLFTKIKAGEIDGATMTLGDMEVEALRAKGESRSDNPVVWYERAMNYAERLIPDGGKYGIRSADRGDSRSYGTDSSGGTSL